MKAGAILISKDIVRLKFDCLVEVREGRVEVTFFLESQSAIKVGSGLHVFRKYLVNLYHLIEIGDGSIKISVAHLLISALGEGIRFRSQLRVRIALGLRKGRCDQRNAHQ